MRIQVDIKPILFVGYDVESNEDPQDRRISQYRNGQPLTESDMDKPTDVEPGRRNGTTPYCRMPPTLSPPTMSKLAYRMLALLLRDLWDVHADEPGGQRK